MLKYFLQYILIVLLFSCSTKQKNVYDENNYIVEIIEKDGEILGKRILVNKFDSSRKLVISYWDNGSILAKSYLHKGKVDGKFEYYGMNGDLLLADSFHDGVKLYSKRFTENDTSVKIYRIGKLEPFTSIDSLK